MVGPQIGEEDRKVSGFQAQEDRSITLAHSSIKSHMGGGRTVQAGAGNCPTESFSLEYNAFEICERWRIQEDTGSFSRNSASGPKPRQVYLCPCAQCLCESGITGRRQISSCYESDVFIGTSLVDMYAKCGSIEDAWKVFSEMPVRNVVSWTAMIVGFAKCGQGMKALELYWLMQREQIELNPVTFVGVLNACASVGALAHEEGRRVHTQIILKCCDHNATFLGVLNACASVAALEEGRSVHRQIMFHDCESDIFVASSLVDMYAKCGSIEEARGVFDKMSTRNMVSWSAILGGYAMHGCAMETFELFEQMKHEVAEMDMVTFVCLLSACSHAELVDKGLKCFQAMQSIHGIPATVEHYACMVDLLGRAGRLEEAEDMIKNMPSEPSPSVSTYSDVD